MLLYVFLLHSRVLDLTFSFLHIPILSLWIAVAAAFLDGGIMRAFPNRIGVALLLLSTWMVICVPFSVWPGGAAMMVKDWAKTMLVFFVVAGLIRSFAQLRTTVFVLAFSILALALLAIAFGDMSGGRLVLSRGRFTNPNDMAQILLMGLPLWWFIATNRTLKGWQRMLAWAAMLPMVVTMSKTGSRGALVAFAVVAFVLFWRSSVSHKVLLLAGTCLLVILAAFLLPAATRERYFTLFKEDDQPEATALEGRVEASAVSSTWGRWGLFRDSVTLTMLHPVFGVGAGQFPVAQDQYSWAVRNRKGAWQVTHNTFTEMSSENGVPGLLFFVTTLVFSFRGARLPRANRARPGRGYDEASSISSCLRLSLLAYAVSALFGCFGYATQLPLLAALVVAFNRTAVTDRLPAAVPRFGPSRTPVSSRVPAASARA